MIESTRVQNLPVVGTVALALQCLLVDRRSTTSRMDTLNLVPTTHLFALTQGSVGCSKLEARSAVEQ
jgi:hypothetical protein